MRNFLNMITWLSQNKDLVCENDENRLHVGSSSATEASGCETKFSRSKWMLSLKTVLDVDSQIVKF